MNNVSFVRWQVLAEIRGKKIDSDEPLLVYHRIVGLDTHDGETRWMALLNLTEKSKTPVVQSLAEVELSLKEGRWLKSTFDPCVPKIRSVEEIAEEHRTNALVHMKARLKTVRAVDDAGWRVFYPRERSTLIRRAAVQHSASWVRELLFRFWRYGGSSYALLPGYMFNGSLSRDEQLKIAEAKGEQPRFSRKRGRKPKSLEAAANAGPEIDPELFRRIKRQFLALLDDKDLQPVLARSFDLRRAIPWQLITDKLNERLSPKIVAWGIAGASPRNYSDVRLLTRIQIKSVGKSILNVGDFVLRVKDWKQIALDHHTPRGDVRDIATRPGERYEIDIAEVDAFFINDHTLLPLGRLFVTFVVDCFSRMIAAAYPWAGEPDVRMISYGLIAAAMPKSEWGRIIGEPFTDDEWPCQGLPETVACDNGEAATHGGDHLAEVAFDVIPNPPFLAYLKQAVETSFRLANVGHIDLLPASTKGPRERGSPDRQKEAKINVATFTRQINRWACHVANHRSMDRYPEHEEFLKEKVRLTPIDLWREGSRIRGGVCRLYVPERHLPALLESRTARIAAQGIDLDGVFYDFTDADRPDWFDRLKRAATAGPAHEIRVHYDRMTLNRIFLVPRDPTKPVQEIPLSRLSRQWEDYSKKEYDDVRAFRLKQNATVIREYKIRKVAFGQSVSDDAVAAEKAITSKFGKMSDRTALARALGRESQIAEQKLTDTVRDQNILQPKKVPVEEQSISLQRELSYDDLLGLN